MAFSNAEINRISGSRLAVQGRQYIETNGDIWMGTADNRLTKYYIKDKTIGVELQPTDPVVDLKTYLKALEDRLDIIVASINTFPSLTVTSNFTVDTAISVYYIDCTAGDITANINTLEAKDKIFIFIKIDSTSNTIFIKDSIWTTSQFNNQVLPFDIKLYQWDGLLVTSNGTKLIGIFTREFDKSLLPTRDEKDAMDNANSPDASNPFLTFLDFEGDITVDSIAALRRQVILNTNEIRNLNYLIGLLVFELLEQGLEIRSKELLNELIYIKRQ